MFTSYIEQFELVFIVNDVKKENLRSLSLIGPKTYNLLRGLTFTQKPKDMIKL